MSALRLHWSRAVVGCVLCAASLAATTDPDYSHREFTVGSATVTIDWDQWGTPLVESTTDEGAFFGWGYAMSVDRFFQMEMARRDILGRQAELLGANPVCDTAIFPKNPLARDETVRRLRLPFFAQQFLDRMEDDHPGHVALLQAFSDGVNQYLEEFLGDSSTWASNSNFPSLLAEIHPLFETYPLTGGRFDAWTPLHCVASLWFVSDGGSDDVTAQVQSLYIYRYLTTGNTTFQSYVTTQISNRLTAWGLTVPIDHETALEVMLGTNVFDEDAATVKELDVPSGVYDDIFDYATEHGWSSGLTDPVFALQEHPDAPQPHFSHGFAVGGARTSNGRACLLGMPQLPVAKWLMELAVKGETFSARGVSFAGCPGFMVGFNDDVAWSITSAGGTPELVYELRMGQTAGQYDPGTYKFNNIKYTISESTESIPVRSGSSWTTSSVKVRWGDAIHHDNTSDPDGEQTIRLGLPIVTDRLFPCVNPCASPPCTIDPAPQTGAQYAVLSYRYFDHTAHTLDAYIDMLSAEDVYDLDAAVQEYANPACTMYAGDKDGNVAFWYLKKIPLTSSSLTLAPLGVYGAMTLLNTSHLCQDIIPINLLPHVVNPTNQLVANERSPIENIVITGNSCVVGAWYPLPIYGGFGDTLRSMRFRELLSAPDDPDYVFTPEELLGFHYDDVDPLIFNAVRTLFHQEDNDFEYTDAYDETGLMLRALEATAYPDWTAGGGHLHSAHPLTGGLVQIGTGMRTPDYRYLTRVVGQAEHGKCRLVKELDKLMAQDPPVDVFEVLADGDPLVEAELVDYITLSVGNGYSLGTTGHPANSTGVTVAPLGEVPDWQDNYLAGFDGTFDSNGHRVVGAKYVIEYHADLLGYGDLDPSHDIESGVLHNPRHGVGAQVANFYSQWVHFRWHDSILPVGVSEHAFTVYNTGNSLHPESEFFHSNAAMWERDGLDFDLADTQANEPTRYLRESPLIQ